MCMSLMKPAVPSHRSALMPQNVKSSTGCAPLTPGTQVIYISCIMPHWKGRAPNGLQDNFLPDASLLSNAS